MATLYQPTTQNSVQYTLDAQLAAGGSSLTLNQSVAGIVQAPGVCWIDRVDTSGNKTPTKREYISFTGVSGTNLTGLTRGLAGSTDQVHAVGAIVEFGNDCVQQQAVYDVINTEHNTSGKHTGITGSTASLALVNTPQLVVGTHFSASGASISGLSPVFIGSPIATSPLQVGTGYYQPFQSYTPSAAATATLDLALGNHHRITMPAGNITIAISNATVGQKFLVDITQDGTGSRTVTWFSTIKWAGGSAPTLTTTGSKRDTFGFTVTGAGTYDGYIVGQNV